MTGTEGRTCNVLCFMCHNWGHYADQCPNASDNNSGNRQGTNIYSMDTILIKEVGASHVNGSCWILVLQTMYLIIVAC